MTDLEILQGLEEELKGKFKKRSIPEMDKHHLKCSLQYAADEGDNVIGIAILRWGVYKTIDFIKEFKQLKYLRLSGHEITDISELKEVKHLTSLYLIGSKIVDISALKELKELETLNLTDNQITDISPLKELTWITSLDLTHNQIRDISSLKELRHLQRLCLDDNPIETPPIEIIKLGKQAIRDWFDADKKKLNEIKVLLVGEAKAGKTSLIKRLKYNEYNAEQSQTDGIVIEPFKFHELQTFINQKELRGTIAYFWDFGGQEIMSSTHEFFMTKRSIYLLVLEARKDANVDKQVRDWMERIKAFGGSSPVIIVGNKIELNPSFGVDITALRKDFPQIMHFINVSCQTGENIETLKCLLAEFIPQAEFFNTEIDERWFDIKNELQEITGKKFTLSHRQFVKICKKHRLTETGGQIQAIRFLNDLGIVLHFDELALAEYYVLDPLWVTAGVYRIITSPTAARQKGDIAVDILPRLINEEFKQNLEEKHRANQPIEYSPDECRFLAEITVQFKLCYYTDDHTRLLIPDLLDKETPKSESEKFYNAPEKLSLVYTYKYLPPTIMPRIIVQLKEDVRLAWRTGVILCCKKNIQAEAMVTAVESRIHIIVLGNHKQKREYLSVIRYIVDQVNAIYNVEVDMQIPLRGYEKHYIKYDTLIKMEKAGERFYKNWEIEKEFEISMLLDGIVRREQVIKRAGTLQKRRKNLRKVEIFLASSIELVEERKEFEIFVNRKNKELHLKGIFLHLNAWEDMPTAVSQTRSQDEYNNEVLDSDIFVVVFFKKVGEYTDEEFETAFKQFKTTGKPLIFTYFKDSEITTGSAKKEDMLSLWAFQEKLEKLGHFYIVYKNTDELIRKFNDQLTKYFDGLA